MYERCIDTKKCTSQNHFRLALLLPLPSIGVEATSQHLFPQRHCGLVAQLQVQVAGCEMRGADVFSKRDYFEVDTDDPSK